MNTLEIKIRCARKIRDILIQELAFIGFKSFLEEDQLFFAYIESEEFEESLFINVLRKYEKTNKINWKIKSIAPCNWNAEWELSYQPIIIKDKYLFRAPFHVENNAFKNFVITPRMAFGTGHHATTEMMLTLMESIDFTNKTVLDFGCGTAILRIFTEYLGAHKIIALDIEDEAIESAMENVASNKCSHIELLQSDLNFENNCIFDVALANITKNTILKSAKQLASILASDGILICSGFFNEDIDNLSDALSKEKLSFCRRHSKEEWAACIFKMNKQKEG